MLTIRAGATTSSHRSVGTSVWRSRIGSPASSHAAAPTSDRDRRDMTRDHRLYATLVRLYPRRFRHDCTDDMVLVFDELFEHKGRAATWRRVVVDLVVTVPIYRLETVMAPQRSTNALVALAVTLTLGAVATFAIGVWPLAAILLIVAVVIGFTERSHLARSLQAENPSHRRRLLARSA